MAQNTTYRQQTSLGLGTETACPTCGGTPPSFLSYEVRYCDGEVTSYVDRTVAFFGSNAIINSNTYSVGQVVWVTATATGARICAEIIEVEVDQEPTMYIDIQSGPFNSCTKCIDP